MRWKEVPSRIDAIKHRYELIEQEQLDGVMESFRARDHDLNARGGGLLGFAGLMMASDLVVLYAEKSLQHFHWAAVAFGAVFVLAAGGWFAYRSLTMAANYSKDSTARAFLERWEVQLRRRAFTQQLSAVFTGLGTSMFLCAMLADHTQWLMS